MIARLITAFVVLVLGSAAFAQDMQRDDLAGRLHITALNNEFVADTARRFGLTATEVLAANWEINPFEPQTRERVVMPTAHLLPAGSRDGIVINLAEYRLYYFKDGALRLSAPVGFGAEGLETPRGETTIVRKQKAPVWHPTASTREDFPDLPSAVPPGPDNPLGSHALYLGWPTYLIHGTIDDYGIGRRYTRGCIRLFPEDIEALFNLVEVGTPVRVIDEPVKLGWHQGELFIEAHPDFEQLEELRLKLSFEAKSSESIDNEIRTEAGHRASDIDWFVVRSVLARRSGIPTQITAPISHPINITQSALGSS